MVDQVSRLATDGPTEAEVARSQIQFERAWLEQCADFASRADTIGAFATFHGDPEMINTRLSSMQQITASDVREAAREFLDPDHRAVLEYHRRQDEQ